jgi:hypothetical protein
MAPGDTTAASKIYIFTFSSKGSPYKPSRIVTKPDKPSIEIFEKFLIRRRRSMKPCNSTLVGDVASKISFAAADR